MSNLTDLLEKASILLTPTAYSNGDLQCIKPNTATGDFDFTRGTIATRVNEQGLIKDVTDTNLPRIDYTGGVGHILIEPQSTNLFLNSATLSTQGVTTSAASHTVSFYGTGSIALSGTHSATINGTGANNRVSLTFTPSSGTLTCTVSGSVTNAQIEALSYATSYIPTSGSTVTRNADVCNNSGSSDLISSTEGVLYAEIASLTEIPSLKQFSLSDGTNNNVVKFSFRNTENQVQASVKDGGTTTANLIQSSAATTINFFKVAIKYKLNDVALWVNGTEVLTDTSATIPSGLNTLRFDRGDGGSDFEGKVKCLAVYKEALTDAQLTALTT
jgi:hypothetical protein